LGSATRAGKRLDFGEVLKDDAMIEAFPMPVFGYLFRGLGFGTAM
jgi:hypothetical protein